MHSDRQEPYRITCFKDAQSCSCSIIQISSETVAIFLQEPPVHLHVYTEVIRNTSFQNNQTFHPICLGCISALIEINLSQSSILVSCMCIISDIRYIPIFLYSSLLFIICHLCANECPILLTVSQLIGISSVHDQITFF